MSDGVTIYHNPRCSKSRQALTLLQDRGVEPEVVLYLQQPPDTATLARSTKLLGITPRELLRRGEEDYKTLGLADKNLSDKFILEAMAAHPKLIERPIVTQGDRAVLGRPPENVLELV